MNLVRSVVKNILVIKLRAIGDVLLSTVVLRNLRAAFPGAAIDFLTEKPSRDVIDGNPDVNTVLVFDNKAQHGFGLIFDVRKRKYDLVVDLFGNPRSALITALSGATYRVGYRFKWRQYCYNIVVEPRGGSVHNTDFNLDALRAIDVPVVHLGIHFPVDDGGEQFAKHFFAARQLDDKFVVALNPGGGWYTKRWRPHQFARLGDFLVGEYGARILLTWGPGEQTDAEQIRELMKEDAVLIPRCTLKQLGAILRRCAVMVTNDSGPMHIAAAMGTPVVALYGPTRPQLQGPVGEAVEVVQNQTFFCLGCNYTKCPIGNPCMEELPVEAVSAGFKRLIERTNVHLARQLQ